MCSDTERGVRLEIAFEYLDDLRRLDDQLAASRKRLTAAVAETNTTVTDVFGVGPVVAAMLLGYGGDIPDPAPLRLLQRHCPDRAVLGRTDRAPALTSREPPAEPRAPHRSGHPDPPRAFRGPGLSTTANATRARPARKRSER